MEKAVYKHIEEKAFVPLLSKSWWMESACGQREWDIVDVEGIAALPVQIVHKWGLRAIMMPIHTQLASIYVDPQGDKAKLLDRLAERLDAYCSERGIVLCSLQGDWEPEFCTALQQRGYTIHQRISYRIPPIYSRQQVVDRLHVNKRRQLKKVCTVCIRPLTVESFYAFHQSCLLSRGKKIDYSLPFAQRVLGNALAHDSAQLWGAFGEEGQLMAAVALVYDERTCYYLFPTYSEQYRDSGVMAWLTTEAIVWSMEHGLTFDFEGSMVPSIARSYREFGGEANVYYGAEKYYSPIISSLFRLWQRWKKRI